MADNSDIINSALRRAMRYENGDGDDFDLTPAYSTADIVRGVDPLAGVGSRLGTKWTTPEQDAALRQRFVDAEHKPTLIGKALGSVGIDESGQRAATPWLDAFLSTMHMPSRFFQAGRQALTAPSRALANDVSHYDTATPQRDEKGNEYISDMGPITPGTAIPEGLNFAGTIASSSPIATATGAVPANTAGMFAGRLGAENLAKRGETRPLQAIELAERLKAEGADRATIYAETNKILEGTPYAGVSYPKDGKPRFEIDDSKANFYRDPGRTSDASSRLRYWKLDDAFDHPELYAAYPDVGSPLFTIQGKPGGYYYDPTMENVQRALDGKFPNRPEIVVSNSEFSTASPKSVTLHELQHPIQAEEGFSRGAALDTFTQQKEAELARDALVWRREMDRHQGDLSARNDAVAEEYKKLGAPDWVPSAEARNLAMDYGGNPTVELERVRDFYGLDKKTTPYTPRQMYGRTLGEVEARTVQARKDLTPDERRARPPWEDYDIPESQQIVRGVSSNPDGASIPGVVVRDAAEKPTRAYHGTPEAWEGRAKGPFWMAKNPDVANQFAMNPYITDTFNPPSPAVMPLNVDTSNYLRIKPNSLLGKFDRRFGEMNVMPIEDEVGNIIGKEGRNWTFDLAKLLGYDGVKWDSVRRDFNEPVMAAIRPTGTVRSATSGDVIYSNPTDIKASAPGVVLRNSEDPVTRALRVARNLDPLGYYSKLDEVLGGFKPTDKVTAQTLQQRGVKASEIEARGLKNLLADGSSVPVSELQGVARGNGVGLNESKYGTTENWVVDPWQWGHGRGEPKSFALRADAESYAQSIGLTPEHATPVTSKPAKWSDHSIDKRNQTYQETVWRLDEPKEVTSARAELDKQKAKPYSSDMQPELDRLRKVVNDWDNGVGGFVDSHFPDDKGYIAHARTAILKDTAGNKVFNIDELQSGIGQKIRDKGARDEGKIAALDSQLGEAMARENAIRDKVTNDVIDTVGIHDAHKYTKNQNTLEDWLYKQGRADEVDALKAANADYRRIYAELETAKAATPSHPLVSTTDQWTTTALRRLIKQAVDSGADAISFTPGKVQAERYNQLTRDVKAMNYNPETHQLRVFRGNDMGNPIVKEVAPDKLPEMIGKDAAQQLLMSEKHPTSGVHYVQFPEGMTIGGEGMRATYDSMYPRTLGKILSKMDPSVKMETRKLVPHNFDPKGMTNVMGETDKMSDAYRRFEQYAKGTPFENDFITFPITDKIRKAVGEGQPLFANSDRSSLPGSALRQGEQEGRVGSGKANKASDGSEEVIKRAINVSADEGAVEGALKVAKNIQDGRKSEVASARLNELNAEISQLNKTAEAAFSAHMAERPEGHPKAAWMSAFETVAPPEWHRRQRLIQERQEIQSKAESKERSAAKREAMQPLNDAATAYADVIANAHKNNELAFRPMSVSDFNSAPHIKLHKSPTHNRTQSSEYRLVMIDGRPAYARKSNHWGAFSTNITDIDDAVRHLGISHAEAERRALSDDFGRIGSKSYNWNLDGDKGSRASRAGYVFLDDLPSAKDSAIKRALSVSGKYTD